MIKSIKVNLFFTSYTWSEVLGGYKLICLYYYFTGNCRTVAGPSPGMKCIFPFTVGEVTHMACTTRFLNPEDTPWCSTKVDDNGNHIGGQGGYSLMMNVFFT